jgi:predicted regulator of Ras-like GTPase activity (Roadblock/LC7/MglB family)
MFASFKKLFRKDDLGVATSIPETIDDAQPAIGAPVMPRPVSIPFPSQIPAAVPTTNFSASSANVIALPVKVVIACLPNSLASAVQSQGNGVIQISAERLAEELPKGAIRLPFGELRMAAPAGTFVDNTRHDLTLIELPLNQILPRLHPSFLSRRTNQKKVVVPPEVGNVFGPRGEGISLSSNTSARPPKPSVAAAAPVANTVPAPAPIQNHAPIRMEPAAPIRMEPSAPIRMPAFEKPAPASAPIPAPSLRVFNSENNATKTGEPLKIALSALSENWPAKIKAEIANSGLATTTVAFPLEKIEPALRSGKIAFAWRELCGWIEPKVENATEASEEMVELPLNVVAPLFMAKHRPTKVQKRIEISAVPDLFVGRNLTPPSPPPAAPPASLEIIPQPVKTEAPAAPQAAPVVVALPKTVHPLGELFGQPTKQNWTPNEIVKNLTAIAGVTGAFIAMIDGLLVAAQLPTELKAETVAAFLPQIFGRMNQYTRELQLGAMSRLAFEVEDTVWQVVKIGSIYLVVLAKSGQELSRENLNRVATEISKQVQ